MKKIYTILFVLFSVISYGQISISWPIDRAVFQRSNSGYATIVIAGQAPPVVWVSTWKLQYQIETLKKDGTLNYISTSWTGISTPGLGKVFRVSKTQSTGWYRLTVRIIDGTTQIMSASVKFGVGEVFLIAGQSNAAGEGSVVYSSVDNHGQNYDCIIASAQSYSNKCSGKLPVYPVLTTLDKSSSYISPNGFQPWAYNMLATKIVDANTGGVPVMLFNAGLSGTSSDDWSVTANDPTISKSYNYVERCTQSGNGYGQGEPFRTLRNCLNYYGSLFGVRTVIWHQGETDNSKNVSSATYSSNLENVIQKSRNYFNGNLPWAVSTVSWDGNTTDAQITNAQSTVRTNKSAANGALLSDTWTNTTYRQGPEDNNQNVHFNIAGLQKLAGNYSDNLSSILAKTPIVANALVPVTITQSGSSKIVTLDFASIGKTTSSFSCFFWTTGDDYTAVTYPSYGCSSSDTYTKTFTANGQWRCYMRETSTGNVYMTQKLTINTSSSVRKVASKAVAKVYPNPTYPSFENTIEFKLEQPALVKLEIMDENGKVIQELANNEHIEGNYHYPFTLKNKSTEIVERFYYRLTINGTAETGRIILD